MGFRLPRVAGLLFFSGAAALVYQTAWLRELRLVFGASTAASAAVLAVFMGGLGVGGALLGKRADRAKNPLMMYANLELLVSLAAALTPLLVSLADAVYIRLGGVAAMGSTVATLVRLLLSVVVLAPPTVVMGGTLPAAARAVEHASDTGRQRVAVLYGVNTFGAVLGALAANFLLLEVFGTQMTLWLACLVNALVGMVARAFARSPETEEGEGERAREAEPADVAEAATSSSQFGWFPPLAAAVSGSTFMLMELVWYRMLGPILGGSSYTFGLILAVALAGIGLGGAIYARSRIRPSLAAFAATCGAQALVIALPYALGDKIAILSLLLRPLCRAGFASSVGVWAFITSIVVLPAAIISGAQFPLVIGLYGKGSNGVGKDVGNAYLANTIGALVGSIAGGFGLLPLLSAPRCWKLVVLLLVATAVLALALDLSSRGRQLFVRAKLLISASPVMALIALVMLAFRGPSTVWRHSGIGAGRADAWTENMTSATIPSFERKKADSTMAWEVDGLESSVALERDDGYTFIVNGKADGHTIGDAPTQVMSGLLGAMLHPDPRKALVVGLGTGSTAGWLGAIPEMERVDVVELEPAILRVARDCGPVNRNVLDNPKVHVELGDARETLRTTKEHYDIIFSEPSNPFRAGISSLYTEEFYRAAAQRLRERGLFIQWVQAYEVDPWAVATAVVTLKQAFKNVSMWRTMRGDLLLVSQNDEAKIDLAQLRERLGREPYRSATRLVWKTGSAEGVLAHHVANPAFADALVTNELGVVNHDDQNALEFAFARGVGHTGNLVDERVRALAVKLRTDRPRVVGDFDEQLLLEENWLIQLFASVPLDPAPATTRPSDRAFGEAMAALNSGAHAKGLKAWAALKRKTNSVGETALVADAIAHSNVMGAETLIDGVDDVAEREVLHAIFAQQRGGANAAGDALERAFTALRTDPWARPSVTHEGLELAAALASKSRRIAERLYAVLEPPMAVEQLRRHRLWVRARIGRTIDAGHCAQALHELEPARLIRDQLEMRLGCYREANDPLTAAAEADLLQQLASEGSFGDSVPAAPLAPGLAAPRRAVEGAPTGASDGGATP